MSGVTEADRLLYNRITSLKDEVFRLKEENKRLKIEASRLYLMEKELYRLIKPSLKHLEDQGEIETLDDSFSTVKWPFN